MRREWFENDVVGLEKEEHFSAEFGVYPASRSGLKTARPAYLNLATAQDSPHRGLKILPAVNAAQAEPAGLKSAS